MTSIRTQLRFSPHRDFDRAIRSMLAIALLGVVSCSAEPNSPVASGIRVVSVVGADTIEAVLSTPLTIEVGDIDGRPVQNTIATFAALHGPDSRFLPEVTVAPIGVSDPNSFGVLAQDTTDGRGRASVQVRLGDRSPEGRLVVTVSASSGVIEDTIAFAIMAGAAVAVRMAPKDTTVYPDRTVQLRARVVDRQGNPRVEPVTYEAGSSLTVSNTGLVTPSTYARSWVVAQSAFGHDTGYISVVPHGRVLGVMAFEGGGPFVFSELDGSRFVKIPALVGGFDAAPAWAPGSTHFVFSTFSLVREQGGELFVADTTGNANRLFPAGTFRNAAYPRYSEDGTWIYFSGQQQDLLFRLWRVRPDGTGAENLGTDLGGGGVDWRPDPGPNGSALAFTTRSGGNWVARTIDVASGDVSSWMLTGLTARWSPRGDRLAVMPDGMGPILVANGDGTNSRALTPGDALYGWQSYSQPFDWSPDGQWLIVNHDYMLQLLQVDTGLLLPLAWSANVAQPTWQR